VPGSRCAYLRVHWLLLREVYRRRLRWGVGKEQGRGSGSEVRIWNLGFLADKWKQRVSWHGKERVYLLYFALHCIYSSAQYTFLSLTPHFVFSFV
jgi:hypothetical protein